MKYPLHRVLFFRPQFGMAIVVMAAVFCDSLNAQEPEELLPLATEVQLLNDNDLNDWIFLTNKNNVLKRDVWTIKDGVLSCKGRPAGYLQTKRWYRDYELQLQWRWPGDKGGNSGVLVHTTTPLLFYGWPKSMEVQLQASSAGDFWVIGKGVDVRVTDEATRRPKPVPGNQHSHRRIRRLPGQFENSVGQWNSMKVVCRGDDIKVFVNDKLVNHGTNSTVTQGAIALQSEGTPIEFKKIRLLPITDNKAATKK